MPGNYIRTKEIKRKISESRKKGLLEGRIKTWNKGLTKKDPRVLKNISGNSRNTQFKKGLRPNKCGNKNDNWKGGLHEHQGYIYILKPEHPNALNGYIAKHRLVMEKHIKRFLKKEEVVHHKDHNTGNNKLNNLMLLKNLGEHTSLHNKERRKNNNEK